MLRRARLISDTQSDGAPIVRRLCSVLGCDRRHQGKGLCNAHYQRQYSHGHLDATRPADWGKRKTHPLYQTWQNTLRRDAGCADEWSDFDGFVDNVKERPSSRHMLVPVRPEEPIGPNNFEWYLAGKGLPRPRARGDRCTVEKCKKIAHAIGLCHMHHARWLRRDTLDEAPKRVVDKEKRRRTIFLGNLRKYGLREDDYDRMLAKQNGVCAICYGPQQGSKPFCVDHCHSTNIVRGLLCGKCNSGIGMLCDDPVRMINAAKYVGQFAKRDAA